MRGGGDGVNVRRELRLWLQRFLVRLQHLWRVQRQCPIRIHSEQQPAGASINEALVVAGLGVGHDVAIFDRLERRELALARAERNRHGALLYVTALTTESGPPLSGALFLGSRQWDSTTRQKWADVHPGG